MLPFVCEVTLCLIVSYHFALLVLQREPITNRRREDAEAARRQETARRVHKVRDLKHIAPRSH